MGGWDLFWLAVTQLGGATFYVPALVIAYLAYDRKLGKKLAATALFSIWLNEVLKNAFKITRPPEEMWKVHVEGYSFPSGHAQGSTVFWGFLAAYYRSPKLGLMAAALVSLISYSRIELGVHYPIDVIGGAVIGLVILFVAILLDEKFAKRLARWGNPSLAVLPPILFLLSNVYGLGGKNASLTMGGYAGHDARASPSRGEGQS